MRIREKQWNTEENTIGEPAVIRHNGNGHWMMETYGGKIAGIGVLKNVCIAFVYPAVLGMLLLT
jgi:hypothetical protein